MRHLVLIIVMLGFIVGCECNASDLPEKECYPLDKIMKDPYMRGSETCKLAENFCTFTSEQKAIGGDMKYMYTHQIPCYQFETYRATHDCTIEHTDVCPDSERYTVTRECIISRTNLIKK